MLPYRFILDGTKFKIVGDAEDNIKWKSTNYKVINIKQSESEIAVSEVPEVLRTFDSKSGVQEASVKTCYGLDNENKEIRSYVIEKLGKIGKEAVPELIKALSDESKKVRTNAMEALGKIDSNALITLSNTHNFIQLFNDAYGNIKLSIIKRLNKLGLGALPIYCQIINNSNDVNAKLSATEALDNLGPAASDAIADLAENLTNKDKYLRIRTIKALGKMGSKIIPLLIAALGEKDTEVTDILINVLSGLENNEATQAIITYKAKLLYIASAQGNISEIKNIISDYNIAVNTTDFYGKTALQIAAENKHWDTVKLLAENGADLKCLASMPDVPKYIYTVLTSRAMSTTQFNEL